MCQGWTSEDGSWVLVCFGVHLLSSSLWVTIFLGTLLGLKISVERYDPRRGLRGWAVESPVDKRTHEMKLTVAIM